MDSRLQGHYETELQFLRELGQEFQQRSPQLADRFGFESIPCPDPHVERLLEGIALLTARVRLKIDARYPQFMQALMEMVYPNLLAPFPACAIAEFAPKFPDAALRSGKRLARGSTLRSTLEKGERTPCILRTAHEVTLWPVSVAEVKYLSGAGALSALRANKAAQAAIRIKLRAEGGAKFSELSLNELDFFIKASGGTAAGLYEQILADGIGLHVSGSGGDNQVPAAEIAACGFEDSQALLSTTRLPSGAEGAASQVTEAASRAFSGYRLLQEYFAFAERFFFFTLRNLLPAVRQQSGNELDLYILLRRADSSLEGIDASNLRLYCTPIVNLFYKTFNRVDVDVGKTEYDVLVDRSRHMDFEVFSIDHVKGIGGDAKVVADVAPFYSIQHRQLAEDRVFYTLQRRPHGKLKEPSSLTAKERGAYAESQCSISITDLRSESSRKGAEIKQLDVGGWCMNRNLRTRSKPQLRPDDAACIERVDCISGPEQGRPSVAEGDTAWCMVSHLALNHLSLQDAASGPELLRKILGLYANSQDPDAPRQLKQRVDGVHSISYAPGMERIAVAGPIAYGRGLDITLTLDDTAYEGTGILMLAEVLERFFARHVSINSFVRLHLWSRARGEIKTWPLRLGTRAAL